MDAATETSELSAEFAGVVELAASLGLHDPAKTLHERRAVLDLEVPVPDGVTVEAVDAGGVPAEWIVAPGASTDRAVLHLHGGTYIGGGLGSHRGFAASVSALTGAAVLLVDYRLAPEHPFPAAPDDVRAAYDWLTGPGRAMDPDRVVVSGDSAGGGLATGLLVALRDSGAAQPAGAVLYSPWVDLALTGDSYRTEANRDPLCSVPMLEEAAEAYAVGASLTDPRLSPLYADLSGLAPLLIHVGEAEIIRDDGVALAERATKAGTHAELYVGAGMIHAWHLFADLAPEPKRDLDAAASWITRRLSHQGEA